MARLIVKSPYIKCNGSQGAAGYMKYIATRERVEILPDDRPPTRKQDQLITKLSKDFPEMKELLEYEDYAQHPTKANASALITLALEENWSKVSSSEGYAKYIATRPRAQRLGNHGLFGDEEGVDLDRAMSELEDYTGNVWTHIISLRREDATRLGYDNAQAWHSLLRTHRNKIAAAMKIPPQDFRWYAAFHDEGEHPHVHMMAWSAKPGQAYLSKDGIKQIKSTLTNQIFKQVHTNPAVGCKLPPLKGKEMKILSQEEIQRFLIQARAEGMYELFLLELTTGMRRGELLALRWDDLDFSTRKLRIDKQVCPVGGKLVISEPKTKAANRTIILPPAMLDLLAEYKKGVFSDLIFPSRTKPDQPIDPGYVRKRLQAILKRAECKKVRFHDLRHPYVKPTTKKYLFFLVPMIQLS